MNTSIARRWIATAAVGITTSALLLAGATAARADTTDGFNPGPNRLLDTRIDMPDHPRGQIDSFTQVTLPDSVPQDASALLSVTVPNPTTQGYIKVYPEGTAPPATSDVNFIPGPTFAQEVVVSPGDGGRVNLAVGGNSKPIDIVVDVVGSFPNASYTSLAPAQRIYDTRVGTPAPGPRPAGQYAVTLPTGDNGVPDDATSVAVTVTQTAAKSPGYLSVKSGTTVTGTSTINYTAGTISSNLVFVKPVAGQFYVGVTGAATNIIIDVKGYSVSPNVAAADPVRVADSRKAIGGISGPQFGTVSITVPTTAPAGASFGLLNATATLSKSGGWIASYQAQPGALQTSNINFATGQTIGGFLLVPIVDGTFTFFVGGAPTQVVADVEGYVVNVVAGN